MHDSYELLELSAIKKQVAQYAAFSFGKQKIMNLMPIHNLLALQKELSKCREALELTYRYGAMTFGGVYDIREAVNDAIRNRILAPQDLLKVASVIYSIESVCQYMKQAEKDYPYLNDLISSFTHLLPLSKAIERCINKAGEIYDNASSELKSIRKNIRICEGEISKEAQRFIARNASMLMDTITTTRNDRLCVLVKISEKNKVDGLLHGESSSGQTAYIEPKSLMLLNNRLQSLKANELEEIQRILYDLSQKVKQHGMALNANIETLAELDLQFSKAQWAKINHGCVATLNQVHHLYLKNARHPLIDEKKAVCNTYELKEPYRSLIISGSNTGGKSVTLKTMGLFVLMTMCGMPLCCEEADVPFVSDIYVDIGDNQSIQESLSTFSSHISRLSAICESVDENALVLLDELGSGTDPKEGEALALAVFDYLRNKNAMVIATTHYSSLKQHAAGAEDILLASVAFDMELLAPTYRYVEGISGQSNAFAIAKRYGLKECIIEHASSIKEAGKTKEDHLMEHLEQLHAQLEMQETKLKQLVLENEQKQQQLQKEYDKINRRKDKIIEKFELKQERLLQAKMDEADEIIALLKESKNEIKQHEITALQHQLDDLVKVEEEIVEQNESFEVGDHVCIQHLNYYGDIVSINKEKAVVLTNGMKMKVSLNQLSKAQKQEKKKPTATHQRTTIQSFSMECNVIGMRVAEAVAVIDKYLDNAILAKVYQVRLIHGMGTGKLRKGVHDYLKRNPRVETYTMGGQGEGGLGATIVTLKAKRK